MSSSSNSLVNESKLKSQIAEYQHKIELDKTLIKKHLEEGKEISKIIVHVQKGGIEKQRAAFRHIRKECGLSPSDRESSTAKAISKKANEEVAKSKKMQQEIDEIKKKLGKYKTQSKIVKQVLVTFSTKDLKMAVEKLNFKTMNDPFADLISRAKKTRFYQDELKKKKAHAEELYAKLAPPKRKLLRGKFTSQPVSIAPSPQYNKVVDVIGMKQKERIQKSREMFKKHRDFAFTFDPSLKLKSIQRTKPPKKADKKNRKRKSLFTSNLSSLELKAQQQEQEANTVLKRINEKTQILAQKRKELDAIQAEYDEYVNLEKEVKDTPPEKLSALYNKLIQQQKDMRASLDQQITQAKVRAQMISKLKQNRIAQLGRSLNKSVDIPVLVIPKYYPKF